jgi:hypothetical protein
LTREVEHVPHTTELHPALLSAAPSHDVRCWLYHDPDGRTIRSEAPPSFQRGPRVTDERGATAEIGGGAG